ncbi:hypothetical protein WN55_06724 [Dufourea novaeangliae]|uniref:Uncharacterized protein n=1 Tax=Dufourea novaeangliae TaxID=178035 RepID=A0A154PQS8_DUFNO|nr:hypothetical protein WN55_06724 [Dufourea novaeangliae]
MVHYLFANNKYINSTRTCVGFPVKKFCNDSDEILELNTFRDYSANCTVG